MGAFGVSGGKVAPLFPPAEASFDDVASLVDVVVEGCWPPATGAFGTGDLVHTFGNNMRDAASVQHAAGGVMGVALIGDQHIGVGCDHLIFARSLFFSWLKAHGRNGPIGGAVWSLRLHSRRFSGSNGSRSGLTCRGPCRTLRFNLLRRSEPEADRDAGGTGPVGEGTVVSTGQRPLQFDRRTRWPRRIGEAI